MKLLSLYKRKIWFVWEWIILYRLKKAKLLLTKKWVYKHFPRFFLWAKFSNLSNVNTENYWSDVHGNEESHTSDRFGQHVLSLLKDIDFNNKEILDVGCGRGTFLSQVKHAKSRSGIDISQKAIEIVKGKGIDGYVRKLPDINLTKKFDIITCFETLEHTAAWKESIRNIAQHLKYKGYFIISVPFENSIVVDEHITYFDVERLYNYLKKYFCILEIKIIGPWLLMICINKQYKRGDVPDYFQAFHQK